MAIAIKVPSPGESISEVTVSKWLKQVVDYVKLDEPLVEL
jgi:2-oxoglutarate dehydrogenase E2 component (dihydrolipoamide succinyltransferase)